jgi:hypothetical protein
MFCTASISSLATPRLTPRVCFLKDREREDERERGMDLEDTCHVI